MSTKKVTAPKTYDPGKGRPKEHLAYLNEREMAYLRSINGNNMERGPRGLPSFPPEDAVGSSSRSTSSGSRTSSSSSGAGRDSSRGLGQGAGGSAVGRGPGGSSGLGGGGKGAGSSGTQSRGPGGPSGPNSGPSQSAGSKAAPSSPSAPSRTPSSPMGGQGQSFRSPMGAGWHNRDTIDRQRAQVNSARDAIRNTPAARSDLSIGGIRTLNVGPIGTPVKVGGPAAVGTKQFYDRVPQFSQPSSVSPSRMNALKGQYGSYKNPNAPMAQMVGDKLSEYIKAEEQFERDMRALGQGVPDAPKTITPTGNPNIVGGPPRGKTRGIGDSLSAPKAEMSVDDIINSLTPKPGSVAVPRSEVLPDVSVPDRVDLSDVYGPSLPKERIISVEDFPDTSIKDKIAKESIYTMGLHGYPKEQMLRPGMYADPSAPSKISKAIGEAAEYRDLVASLNRETQKVSGVDDVYDPSGEFNQEPKIPNWAQSTYTGQRPSVADASSPEPSGVESSGEVLSEDGYGYPTNPDGSPITAEDIADMPPEIQREYFDKIRHARRQDTPYPLTAEEKMKARVAGIVTKPLRSGAIGVLTKAGSYLPGPIGEGFEKLSDPKTAVEEYERANPLRQRQIAERAGRGRGSLGIGTITSSLGGGTPDIGSGGKAEYRPIPRQFADYGQADASDKKESGRPQAYYNWDAGVGIPSPGDPDYTLYLKYLEEKAAARAAVS